jgi:hypothetical protein
LDLDYRHDTISDDWFWPKVPHGNDDLLMQIGEPSPISFKSCYGQIMKGMDEELQIRFIWFPKISL